MNHILSQMADRGAEDLRAAIEDKEPEILKAIQKMAEEREGDAPLKFRASLSIIADLDANVVETAVSYSVKTTVKGKHAIETDETPSLFGEEDA
jgi:hypothetical protein